MAAQEVCRILEYALSTSHPVETAVELLSMKNPPLHIIQTIADKSSDKSLKQILLKLARQSDSLPSTLFLRGVTCASVNESFCGGAYADIFVGGYENHQVALKRMRVHQIAGVSIRNKIRRDFYREALIWRNLGHRHILPFLGIDSVLFSQSLCMVSPWMTSGNIRDVIGRMKSDGLSAHARITKILIWYNEISLGLEYLHGQGVVHGDLRGPNILIDDDNHVRISDFGLAVFAESASGEYSSIRGGNERWLAPEVIYPEIFGLSSSRPTRASDVYSFACLCLEMFTGSNPFQGFSPARLLSDVPKGLRPSRPEAVDGMQMPDSVWRLLCMCWERYPSDRPDMHAIVEYTSTHFLRSQEQLEGLDHLNTHLDPLNIYLVRKQEQWETPEATKYLDKVFEQCAGSHGLYEGTSRLLENLLHGIFRLIPEVAIQHVVNFLSGYPQLIENFKIFLPTNLTFRLSGDFHRLRMIVIDREGGERSFRASFGLIEVSNPKLGEMDKYIFNLLDFVLINEDHEDAVTTLQGGDAKRALDLMEQLVGGDRYWQVFLEKYPHHTEHQYQIRNRVLQISRKLDETGRSQQTTSELTSPGFDFKPPGLQPLIDRSTHDSPTPQHSDHSTRTEQHLSSPLIIPKDLSYKKTSRRQTMPPTPLVSDKLENFSLSNLPPMTPEKNDKLVRRIPSHKGKGQESTKNTVDRSSLTGHTGAEVASAVRKRPESWSAAISRPGGPYTLTHPPRTPSSQVSTKRHIRPATAMFPVPGVSRNAFLSTPRALPSPPSTQSSSSDVSASTRRSARRRGIQKIYVVANPDPDSDEE